MLGCSIVYAEIRVFSSPMTELGFRSTDLNLPPLAREVDELQ